MLCGIRGPHDGDCTYWRGALQPSRSEFLNRSRIRLPRDSRRYQSPSAPGVIPVERNDSPLYARQHAS